MVIQSTLARFDSNVWDYHLHITKEQAKKFVEDNRRVICTINNTVKLHCALMPYPSGYFILMNQANVKKLNINEGDMVSIFIEKDTSAYGIPMPDSFLALLSQDDQGSEYFHKLTPGKQRSLIYIVGKVKNIDSQINKGLAILDHLTEAKGKLDFKNLNTKIKDYNQRSKLNK